MPLSANRELPVPVRCTGGYVDGGRLVVAAVLDGVPEEVLVKSYEQISGVVVDHQSRGYTSGATRERGIGRLHSRRIDLYDLVANGQGDVKVAIKIEDQVFA